MIFYLLLCNILFIPIIHSSNTTIRKPEIANKTLESRKVNLSNQTKVTLLSEGGSLLPETSDLVLPKEKLTTLDSELGKNKVKTVVARKGVVYIEDENVKPQSKHPANSNENTTIAPTTPAKILNQSIKLLSNSTNKSVDFKAKTLPNKISSGAKVNTTETPKKPQILNYDALANVTVKSSPGTMVTNQIQSPNKEFKAYAKNANSHPGMIMPLVITVLLVPMFAVLGYMTLRRGQEAWKNRHYKRMDFLLDGMYND